jgi:hypothetical protein
MEMFTSIFIIAVQRKTKRFSNVLNLPFRRRIGSPVIILNSKSFFTQRLGGGTQSSCFARPQKSAQSLAACVKEKQEKISAITYQVGATS